MQNGIEKILRQNKVIPVVTIHNMVELESIYQKLKKQNISVIEITLRTAFAWEAIKTFKEKYGNDFSVGVGTVINAEQIERCKALKVDFVICPGLTTQLIELLKKSDLAFLAGVSTPSEIMRGIEQGWQFFKFFPAELFGGISALKAYQNIFNQVKFCPTGGVNEANYKDYLALDNVLSVGGSWLTK